MKHLEASLAQHQRPQHRALLAAFCALLLASYYYVWPQFRASSVRIGDVIYVGHHNPALKQTTYLGIPYANPPVDGLRFKPPTPYVPDPAVLARVRKADAFGPSCPQSTPVPYDISEDCLTANVWVPHVSKQLRNSLGDEIERGLPVLVWIYGGAFINGSTQKYPAHDLVEASIRLASLFPRPIHVYLTSIQGKPTIVASFNYRLGMFGFPIGVDSDTSNTRNLGLLDQRLALEWIHANIAQFGGDPNKASIFPLLSAVSHTPG
ncbi:carbohydrate esterase family 10 protein [Ceratobasidium sp. AG-Ba]|nr:carbohydrate esterase family 10 protein [Ceratobasidium sp. AG-Ba]QRW08250.1 carbohydrate esterase family 10 protein [Ceratobasidium sp. AG-Ba]